jgi:cytochrome c5
LGGSLGGCALVGLAASCSTLDWATAAAAPATATKCVVLKGQRTKLDQTSNREKETTGHSSCCSCDSNGVCSIGRPGNQARADE